MSLPDRDLEALKVALLERRKPLAALANDLGEFLVKYEPVLDEYGSSADSPFACQEALQQQLRLMCVEFPHRDSAYRSVQLIGRVFWFPEASAWLAVGVTQDDDPDLQAVQVFFEDVSQGLSTLSEGLALRFTLWFRTQAEVWVEAEDLQADLQVN